MSVSSSTARRASPGRERAGHHQEYGRQQDGLEDAQEPEPGGGHHGGDDAGHEPGLTGGGRRAAAQVADQQELAPVPPAVAEAVVGEQQQRVALPELHVAQLLVDPLPGPVDAHDRGLEGPPELGLPERLPRQRPGGADHGLEERVLGVAEERGVLLLLEGEAPDLLEVPDQVHPAHERQPVAAPEQGAGGGGGDDLVAPDDLRQEHALEVPEPRLLHRAAVQRAAGPHPLVQHVLPGVLGELLPGAPADGQEPAGEQDQEEESGHGHGHPDPGQLEQPQRLHPGLQHESRDHQVRARPDERERAPQDGGEAQRHQQPGRAEPPTLRPVGNLRRQHGHHRRVVQHRRRERRRHQQLRQPPGPAIAALAVQRPPEQRLERAGLLHRPGHHEQRGHGDGRRVAEPGERLLRVHHAGHQEHDHREQQRDGRREQVPDHRRQRRQHDPEGHPRLPAERDHRAAS